MFDVLIVGGGPVGSQTAIRLANAGYNVGVIDQKNELDSPVCCTGIVSEECVQAFQIDEKVILRHVQSATIFAPAGGKIRLWRPLPQAAILNRPAFNDFMATRAKTYGAEYFTGSRVTDVAIERGCARIKIESKGIEEVLIARILVIATGFIPYLTEQLGLGKPGIFVAGAQAELSIKDMNEVELYLGKRFAPGFFAWLVPTSPGRALAGLLSKRDPRGYLDRFVSYIVSEGKATSNSITMYTGGIPLRPLTRTYGDRLLIVGTAAGQVKPTTGGGIYYGLLCADIAARVIGDALHKNDLSSRTLSAYQREWKAKLEREMRIGSWARKFYEHLGDSQIDKLFDIMKSTGMIEALLEQSDLSFDWHSHSVNHLLRNRTLIKLIKGFKIPLPTGRLVDSGIPREENKLD